MKKTILVSVLLLVFKVLPAQFTFGTSGAFAVPTGNELQINYAAGVNVNFGYGFKEKFIVGIHAEKQWVFSELMPASDFGINDLALFARYVIKSKSVIEPYVDIAAGISQRTLKTPMGFDLLKDDGVLINPSVGFLSALHIIKGLYLDVNLGYKAYFIDNATDMIQISIGVKYFLLKH